MGDTCKFDPLSKDPKVPPDPEPIPHKIDRCELGEVDSVHDLEVTAPERDPARVTHEQARLQYPIDKGYFERDAFALAEHDAGPLVLSGPTLDIGGSALSEYMTGYNLYAAPLRQSVRAMGRVKDLSEAGAPMTPAQLQANPKLAGRFRKLSLTEYADAGPQVAFNTWASDQSRLQLESHGYAAAQMQMYAALENWHRVQMVITQRKAEAEKDGDSAQLQQIDAAAATCAQIVRLSGEALAGTAVIGDALEASRALATVEGGDGAAPAGEDLPQKDPLPDPRLLDARTHGDKAHDQVKKGLQFGQDAAQIMRAVHARKPGALDLQLSLDDMFVVLMGNGGKKLELEKNIDLLSQMIGNLKWNEVTADIHEGRTRLLGLSMQVSFQAKQEKSESELSRNGAQAFNQSLHGGDAALGEMAMYMAEAQQERALFGRAAQTARHTFVDAAWRRAFGWIDDWNHASELISKGHGDEAQGLAQNLHDVSEQRAYVDRQLPGWARDAAAWRGFLEQQTGKRLVSVDGA